MKLQVAILSMLLPISSFAGAINCNLHVYNKNTHESSSVELKPIDSNKMYFVLSAELSEFGASYGSNLLGNTESLVIADAEGVMSSMEVEMGLNQKLKLDMARDNVFATLECTR